VRFESPHPVLLANGRAFLSNSARPSLCPTPMPQAILRPRASCSMFGPVASCPYESLLDGPKTEDRRGGLDWYAQGTSRPHLRCRPLDGQTLPRQGRTWRRPDPAQAARQAPQGGRDCAEAPRARPGRTPDVHAAGERPAAGARGRGRGERLYRLANPEAHGIQPKKDRWVRQNATSS
jgi:hypothetical protein